MANRFWLPMAKRPDRESKAYNTGYQDYQLGQPVEANPFIGEEMRAEWLKGWTAASTRFLTIKESK